MKNKSNRLGLGLLTITASLFLGAMAFDKPALGVSTACLTLFGVPTRKQEEFDTNLGSGGSALAEKDFQAKVLGNQKALKVTTDEMVEKYENLDKDTKKAFEELTKLKNDNTSSMEELTLSIKKLNLQMRNEYRMANGDPIQRIIGDPEKKELFNAIVRNAAGFGMTPAMRTTLGEDSTPGSTMIKDDLAADIYDTLASYGIWSSFDVRRVGTKTTKFPVKTARAAATFILTEGGDITEDTAKAGTSVDLTLEVIAALLPVSKQLLADSEFDVTADVLADFAEAIAFKLDWACTQADGGADATDGNNTGIFGGGATACVAATGNVSVETLDFEDWTKALLTVDPVVLTRASRWWMHPQQLVRALSIKDLSGRPIFLTALEAPTASGMGSILGYGVVPTFAAPSANTTSTKIAVFGDPKGMVVGIQNGFEFESSDHAGFTTYERYFRGVARGGVKIRRALAFAALTTAAS